MASQLQPNAASIPPYVPPAMRDSQLVGGEARRQASPLPSWCSTAQGRSLITAILAERPERTRVINSDLCGNPCGYGYAGRSAAQLRAMFDRTFDLMLQDADRQRDALVSWRKANNADEIIRRVLADAA